MESFGFRSVPIIALINLLVGAIVAQQGIFQLRRFGAATFAVDLIGILVLRELGVLLTSIMIAGRSGSAITAELGSMKMREEIDALRVMGLSPIEVLVTPRILALVLSLPLLTFLADMSALFGGLLVCWVYAGISPDAYLSLAAGGDRPQHLHGRPHKGAVHGADHRHGRRDGGHGDAEGSAESLGRQVTASVVKSIFMVIVVDGLFADLLRRDQILAAPMTDLSSQTIAKAGAERGARGGHPRARSRRRLRRDVWSCRASISTSIAARCWASSAARGRANRC